MVLSQAWLTGDPKPPSCRQNRLGVRLSRLLPTQNPLRNIDIPPRIWLTKAGTTRQGDVKTDGKRSRKY